MSDPALRLQGHSSTAGVCGAQLWQGLPDKPTALAWHPSDASTLAFGCEDGAVGLFDVGASIGAVFAARHAGPVIAVAWQRPGPVRQRGADGKPEQGNGSAREAEPSALASGEPGRGNGSAQGLEMAPTLLTLGEDGRLLSWGALDVKGQALARSAAAPAAPVLQGSPTDLLQAGALGPTCWPCRAGHGAERASQSLSAGHWAGRRDSCHLWLGSAQRGWGWASAGVSAASPAPPAHWRSQLPGVVPLSAKAQPWKAGTALRLYWHLQGLTAVSPAGALMTAVWPAYMQGIIIS